GIRIQRSLLPNSQEGALHQVDMEQSRPQVFIFERRVRRRHSLPHQRIRPFHVLKQFSDCCQEFHVTFLSVGLSTALLPGKSRVDRPLSYDNNETARLVTALRCGRLDRVSFHHVEEFHQVSTLNVCRPHTFPEPSFPSR